MKASLLAVAVLATIAISSAVDEECVQRKVRGLPVHWPNPTDCSSFYRCTNKNVKRELLCPIGKEYNSKTGRCANLGKNLCKLSLKAPLAGPTNPCADAVSGSFVAAEGSCRSFNICSDNMAYPQNCDAGSYFNTSAAVCEPDTEISCWENLCLTQANGVYLANDNDCHSFYVCADKQAVSQECPAGSYFETEALNCQPGVCPSEITTTITTETCTDEVTTPTTEVCTDEVTTPSTLTCTDEVTTPTTEVCTEEVTTISTVTCTDEVTTPTTEACTDAVTTPSTETCTDEVTTPTTEVCTDEVTTPTTNICTDEVTTPTTQACTDEITTPTTVDCTEITTIASTEACTDEPTCVSDLNCDCTQCLNAADNTVYPALNTNTGFCRCLNKKPNYYECADGGIFEQAINVCVAQDKICPSSKCVNEPDFTLFPAENTTAGYCKCINNEASYENCADSDYAFDAALGICVKSTSDEVTTDAVTTPTTEVCTDEVTTPTTEICTDEFTTPTTQACTDAVTTPTTVDCTEITTIVSTEACTDEPTCVSDLNCDCTKCLNAADNTVYPALNTNTGFCRCLNKKPNYYECADGGIFEQAINVCVAQDKICPSSKCVNEPDYTLFPAANTTSGYCKCINNEASYENCAESDYAFDAALGICVKSPSDDCEEENSAPASVLCEGGYTEGDFVVNSDNCMLFYICFDGQLIESSCDTGNYYDAKSQACVTDTNGVCPQCTAAQEANVRNKRSIKAATCSEGDITCHPTDCDKFYICDCDGNQILQECGVNNYFNATAQECQADTNNVCKPKVTCTCPGGYEDGEMSPHSTDCDKFYICSNGEQILHECGQDNYYNPDTQCCQPDGSNECWPKIECTCPGGYQEGQFSPHPNPLYCNKYYICTDGQQVLQECGVNNYFNNKTLQCELDTNNVCVIDTNCTCPGGYEEGQFSPHPNPLLCGSFYVCSGSKQILQECGLNQFFNKTSLECEVDKTHVCWPNQCAGQVNGSMVANPQLCSAYFLCQNQEPIGEVCAEGQYFDSSKSSCQPDVDADCYNPCAKDQTINLLPHPDCTKYNFCNGPQTIVGTCQSGGFDADLGVCNPNKVCPGNECIDKFDSYTFANPDNKTQFYICLNGVAVLQNCPPNRAFNADVANGICLPIADPDCDPTPCLSPRFNEAYQTLNKSNNEFCYCKNGLPVKLQCQADMVFNNDIGVCFSNAACDPIICPNSKDYVVSPNRNDTQSFCMCVTKTAVIVPCPNNGTFNPFTLTCSNVEISTQCNQFQCIKQADNYKFDALNKTDNGFCLCKEQIATFIPCEGDSTYNPTIGICMQANINCNSKQCVGLANNTKIPAITTNQGYCECVSNKATFVNCAGNGVFNVTAQNCSLPVCDIDNCTAPNNYQSFPASNTTTGFCLCMNDNVVYKDCPYSQEFNIAVGVCTAKLINCEDSMCNGIADGTSVPAVYTQNGFCYCMGGEATFEQCPPNYTFNKNKQFCQIDTEALCGDSTLCNSCFPTLSCSSYSAKNSVTGFCVCSATGPKFVACEPGYEFTGQVCKPTAQSNCDISECANATLDSPITSPAINGNTSFCYCTGSDDVMLLNCPSGKYFNNNLKLCTNVIEESCSCPNGIQNGEIVADTSTCNKYFECLDGVMHEQVCAPGQYFNDITKICCVDTEGICSNQSQCTCLGAYHEGERIEHPVNGQMYYVCQNAKLHERNCGVGRIFNKSMNQCIKAPRLNSRYPRKRSVDHDANEVRTFKKISTLFTKFLL